MTHGAACRRVSVVGATASGKSAVAMEVARRLPATHLISVDSMQVYRGMDIGTAKPSATEQQEVPHHCIDLVDATEEFTLVDYQHEHAAALDRVAAADGRAVLVGGTGLYQRAVVDRLDLPGRYPEAVEELEAEPDTVVLYDRLVRLDPAAARKIEPGNRRRIVRALEVTIGGGRPFSSYGPGLDTYPPTVVSQIGLRRGREEQSARIEARVARMIAVGWVDEVRELSAAGFSRTSAQALGYPEIRASLAGEISQDDAIGAIVSRTRRFAVRQERWFRRDPRIRWFDVVGDDIEPVVAAVVADLEASA